ncbi:fumarylacetoacetate hydrolase family protein [Streptomyces sp. NPDC096094]|uniref:fumarylacetoacetate hydrolase family protein n=1 Tax=Streptomyces sp. NPDC096094 TaxID=3366073 RepID=UPI003825A55E
MSRTVTLRPGDLLATGTPSGVDYAGTPLVTPEPRRHGRGRGRPPRHRPQYHRRSGDPPSTPHGGHRTRRHRDFSRRHHPGTSAHDC